MLRPTSALMALLVLAIPAGCDAVDPSPGASDEADPSPPDSVAAGVTELVATDDPLPPGRYTRSAFVPPITIELDGAWTAVQLYEGFFDIQQDVGSPDVIAVQFARPSAVIGATVAGEVPDGHADAVEILRSNPSLTVLETSESRIGGLVGSQVTVENAGQGRANVMAVPPGPLGIDPGRRLWMAFFDTDAGLLAIMIGGSAATWDAALAAAEPVLESVTIGP